MRLLQSADDRLEDVTNRLVDDHSLSWVEAELVAVDELQEMLRNSDISIFTGRESVGGGRGGEGRSDKSGCRNVLARTNTDSGAPPNQ